MTIGDAFIYLLLVQRSDAGPQWIPLLYTGTAVSFLALARPRRIPRRPDRPANGLHLRPRPAVLAYGVAFGGLSRGRGTPSTCVVLLGAYYACPTACWPASPAACCQPRRRAMGLAWVATGVSVGRFCSAMVFGFLWTRAGDRIAVAAFTTALVVVLCAALATRGTGRRGRVMTRPRRARDVPRRLRRAPFSPSCSTWRSRRRVRARVSRDGAGRVPSNSITSVPEGPFDALPRRVARAILRRLAVVPLPLPDAPR